MSENGRLTSDVCVVGGCGHVGLPLALSLAATGLKVSIHDTNDAAVKAVSAGEMPFLEDGAVEILDEVVGGRLIVANDVRLVSAARVVVVVIGTPVDEHLNPTFHAMRRFFRDLAPHLADGQCVILRSTVYPGTTEKVRGLLQGEGRKLHLAYCPERIAQGHAIRELKQLPQIISGCDSEAVRMAAELFGRIAPSCIQLTPIEAELAKVFTNTWRYIQFATANQFLMMALDHGVDFYRVYDALVQDYPRMQGLPRGGFAAGPCLLKDTMQLAAAYNNNFQLGHAAMLVNEGLPSYLVRQMVDRYPLSRMKVGILGMTFKADVDDSRESLSFKLRKLLEYEAAEVLCTDEYLNDPRLLSLSTVVERSDILVLGAPHAAYRRLRLDPAKPLVDVWNFFGKGVFGA